MKGRKGGFVAFLAVVVLSLLAGASASGTPGAAAPPSVKGMKVYYLNPFAQDPFWIGAENGTRAAAKALGVNLKILDAGNSAATQATEVTTAVQQGAKVIVVAPVDSKAILPQLKAAKKKGVTIVALNRPISSMKLDGTVQIAEVNGGRAAAKQLVSLLQKAGVTSANVLQLEGAVTDEAAQLRGSGFQSGLRDLPAGMTINLIQKGTNWDVSTAATAVENVLSTTHVDALYTESDFLLPGIVPVLQRDGYTVAGGDKHMIMVGVGGLPQALTLIKQGWQDATLDFAIDRQAAAALYFGVYLHQKVPLVQAYSKVITQAKLNAKTTDLDVTTGGPSINMTPVLVTKANVDDPGLWGNKAT
jgi:ABC-type sugar transport system substrate-binding protein